MWGKSIQACWLMVLWAWIAAVPRSRWAAQFPTPVWALFALDQKVRRHAYNRRCVLRSPTTQQEKHHMAHTLPFPCRLRKTLWLLTSLPETFEYHYGKHHQAYVTNLNNLIPGTEFENMARWKTSSSRSPAAASTTTPPRSGITPFFWNHEA